MKKKFCPHPCGRVVVLQENKCKGTTKKTEIGASLRLFLS